LVVCHGGPGHSDNLGVVADMVDDIALVHRHVAELARRGTYVELEDNAHAPWLEEPARLRSELRRFLTRLT
jgi:pimeloyl-ACP methyl ester carboxylesterase